jgi:hypothetical protein
MMHQQIHERCFPERAALRAAFHDRLARSHAGTAWLLSEMGDLELPQDYAELARHAWQNAKAIEREWSSE